ncbi:hypothetical protein QBC32DRAFT_336517 [Pseudoneurospora amorphoporcata]|uniref:Uncharacterized protein n=1 Tax=Pseudoneurospora amorphoporcata TaxID=241081 RepID=A0AAN6P0M1_9PEZI|nr:hypothetical protein QBC32DRAFT_336517 [Pseudoneurospora amorphoporcata]
MSPLSPLPPWFNDEDMECPSTPIMKQPSSPLASLTSSLLLRLESNHFERSSLSPLLVGQALAPSAVLFPNLPAPALQLASVVLMSLEQQKPSVVKRLLAVQPRKPRRHPRKTKKADC